MLVNNLHFKKAMAVVEHARDSRVTTPILAQVRATQVAGGLKLETTDLDMTFTATLPAESNGGAERNLGEFLIADPRAVISAISAAGGKDVTIKAGKPKAGGEDSKGVNHTVAITAGELKLTQKNRNHAADFPVVTPVADDMFTTEMSADVINHIARVFPAMPTEETRYYLNGVSMKKLDGDEWTYRFAATDGHRLFVVDVPLPSSTGELSEVIVPRRFISAAANIMGKSKDAIPFKIGGGRASNQKPTTTAPDNRVAVRCSLGGKVGDLEVTFDSKLIDGTYPDYGRAIPTQVPRQAWFNVSALRRAVQAVSSANSDKKLRALKLSFEKGRVVISKYMWDIGGTEATFAVECVHNCDGMTAGFNGKYLLEALNSFRGEEIVLSMEEPSKAKSQPGKWLQVCGPMLIRDPADTAFFVVLMPIRI